MRSRRGALVLLAALLAAGACGSYGERDPEAAERANRAAAVETGLSNEEAAMLHLAACPDGELGSGVTDDDIRIGTSSPETGPFAAFGEILPGIRAAFAMANREGGVEGRNVVLEALDDGYDPRRTHGNVDALLGEQDVFGLLAVVGTPNVLTYWDMTEERCVPNLFVATGSPYWGDERGHPWTIGSLTSYATESAIFADHLDALQPDATIAMLEQNDEFGRGYADGLRDAIEDTDLTITATELVDPQQTDFTTEVAALEATGADAVLAAVTGLGCPAAMRALQEADWQPITYVSGTCAAAPLLGLADGAADGVLSTTSLMDPLDPAWNGNPAMEQYRAELARTQPGADPGSAFTAYGWTVGLLLIETLRSTDHLTRPAVMAAARNLDAVSAGLLLPGVELTTGPGDPYPVESTQLEQYDADRGLWSFLAVGSSQLTAAGPSTVSLSTREGRTAPFSARD